MDGPRLELLEQHTSGFVTERRKTAECPKTPPPARNRRDCVITVESASYTLSILNPRKLAPSRSGSSPDARSLARRQALKVLASSLRADKLFQASVSSPMREADPN